VNLTKAFCVCMRPGARKVTGRPAFAALWRRAVSQSILSSLRKAEAISGGDDGFARQCCVEGVDRAPTAALEGANDARADRGGIRSVSTAAKGLT
jgi:hypothetical protein